MTDRVPTKPEDVPLLRAAEEIARETLDRQDRLSRLNHLPNIEWSDREKIRAMQGHYSKIEDIAGDVIWGIGSDEAADIAESIWPNEKED